MLSFSVSFLSLQDGRVRDLAQLFQAKTRKIVEDTTKKLRIVEHLQVKFLNIRNTD